MPEFFCPAPALEPEGLAVCAPCPAVPVVLPLVALSAAVEPLLFGETAVEGWLPLFPPLLLALPPLLPALLPALSP